MIRYMSDSPEHASLQTQLKEAEDQPAEIGAPESSPELETAIQKLEEAKERLLSAALAFCDGTISAGQLRAVRELFREQEQRVERLEGSTSEPFIEDTHSVSPKPDVEMVSKEILEETAGPLSLQSDKLNHPELAEKLAILDQKIDRLEEDFQQGRINASQYRAIRRHYTEQREVALRLKESHPESDRWRVVLEEGRTSFLMQLNEAVCTSVSLFDIQTRKLIFDHGTMPDSAEEAMGLLRTFGSSKEDSAQGRMLATHTDDDYTLLLIPGKFTAMLAVFSQDPPGWQVRALREVHLNFEAANQGSLLRGQHRSLIFPDLKRFVKT